MPRGSRAAALVAGAGLVAAWLAAAADRQTPPVVSGADRDSTALVRAEQLAQEIESQAARLRTRLASAPQPAPSERNPFSFQVSPPRPTRMPVAAASVDDPAALPIPAAPEPAPLTLSGIAEEASADDKAATPVRTAVLSGFGDVFLAKAGDTLAGRYQVTAVGADAVELKDLTTGRTIRLGLR